jgi:hypothetical protein
MPSNHSIPQKKKKKKKKHREREKGILLYLQLMFGTKYFTKGQAENKNYFYY